MKRASAIFIHGTRQMKRQRVKAPAMAAFSHVHVVLSSSNACQSPDNRAFKGLFAVFCNILPSSVKERGFSLRHYAVGAAEYEVFIGVAGPAPFPIP